MSTGAGKGKVLYLKGARVTFKVYWDTKGLGAQDIKNEDGNPLEYENRRERKGGKKRKRMSKKKGKKKSAKKSKIITKRRAERIKTREIDEQEKIYTGTVMSYEAHSSGYGFISIDENITFNGLTVSKTIYVMKEDIICFSENVGLTPDTRVIFKIYKDSNGLGAYEVHNEDGTPIIFEPNVEAEVEAKESRQASKSVSDKV